MVAAEHELEIELEAGRLQALESLEILDTAPESEYDDLVGLAAAICGTPISMVSLVDANRQWFKAALGIDTKETPRELAFCGHAIKQPGLFVVEDALEDVRFAENPFVTGAPHMRFYAGMPLTTQSGFAMGTLCVIDMEPRRLTTAQKSALVILARQVTVRMEMRTQQRALDAALAEKERVAVRLQASEDLFRTFMNNSPVASFIKNAQGRFVFRNTRHLEAFGDNAVVCMRGLEGGQESRLSGMPNETLIGAKDGFGGDGHALERTEVVERQDGLRSHWRTFEFPCHDEEGRTLLGCVAVDVTGEVERSAELARYQIELEEANDRLRDLAVTDGLTGLRNRRAFEERLAFEFSMARRKKRELSVVLVDADDFKKVNDRLGHAAGDSVLRHLATVLQDAVRLTDLAARFGGEEFAVILPESDERSALLWCRRMQKALAAAEWGHPSVTVSMGVAGMTAACADGNQLVALADQALYRAKRRGKNCFVGSGEVEIVRAG